MNNRNFSTRDRIFSVFEITENIKSLIERNVGYVFVRGEVSNLRTSDAGHAYFTLKDEKSQIAAVLFRSYNIKIDFGDGSRVIVGGLITIYSLRGVYQIIVDQVIPDGLGDLYRRYEERKRRLYEEGLFSEDIKKDLPRFSFHIGLITSPYGAAVRDFLRTAWSKSSFINISIYSVRVQGEGAADDIISAIRYFNERGDVDVIAIVRGGGSFEDLFCFNDESLAYMIRESNIPVVTGIGHEVDFTIADYVADLRAATPTAAAEAIVRTDSELLRTITDLRKRMDDGIRDHILSRRKVIDRFLSAFYRDRDRLHKKSLDIERITDNLYSLINRLLKGYSSRIQNSRVIMERHSPLSLISQRQEQISFLNIRMRGGILNRIDDLSNVVKGNILKLDLLSPENILKKGYSVVYKNDRIVRGADELADRDSVRIRFHNGDVGAVIKNNGK